MTLISKASLFELVSASPIPFSSYHNSYKYSQDILEPGSS